MLSEKIYFSALLGCLIVLLATMVCIFVSRLLRFEKQRYREKVNQLCCASKNGNLEDVAILLEAWVDVNAENDTDYFEKGRNYEYRFIDCSCKQAFGISFSLVIDGL
jgi:hypothetical protein